MKKIFLIIFIFTFIFGNTFANVNPKIIEINLNIYKKKIEKDEKGKIFLKRIDEKILTFSKNELEKYSKNLEKYLKNYTGKNLELFKYIKFKIDSLLVSGKISENKSEKNLKILKDEKTGLEFSFEAEKYFEILTKEDEKNLENKIINEKNFYIGNKREKNLKFYYFLKAGDIGFTIFPGKGGEFLNIDEMKKEFIRQDNLSEKDLEEIEISGDKFYKYLQKFKTENSKNNYGKELKVYNYLGFINETPYYFTVLLDEKYKNELEKILKKIKIYEKSENKKILKKEFKNKYFKIYYRDEKFISLKENDFGVSLKKIGNENVYSLNIIKKDLPKEFKNYDEYIIFTKQRYNGKLEMEEKFMNSKKFLKIFLGEKQDFKIYNYLINGKKDFYFEIEISYKKEFENEVLEILKSFEFLY